VNVTTEEKEKMYTRCEVHQARIAYKFMEEAIRLLEDGNLQHTPNITRKDVAWAFKMYAPPAEYVRGKLTKKTVSRVQVDEELHLEIKSQYV
jgi:hypothetical protein